VDLTKWDSLMDIENIVDRALNWSNARFTPALPLGGFGPRVDIHESDDSYMIKADMPGVDKEALSVGIEGEMLTIQGQRGRESLEGRSRIHRLERYHGTFSRSFSLPEDADGNTVNAVYENGELTVTIAKKSDVEKPRTQKVPVTIGESKHQ